MDTYESKLIDVAALVYGPIAQQTAAHAKGGENGRLAIEEATKTAVQVASRILANTRSFLANEQAQAQAATDARSLARPAYAPPNGL